LRTELVELIVPPNGVNVPDEALDAWETITVHETANENPGADALMHNLFVRNGGGKDRVSFTFVVDSRRIVQNLPLRSVNYAQGTRGGNRRSVSIELCVNRDGDFTRTLQNAARLIAALLLEGGLDLSAIVQHWTWYGKNCPAKMRANPRLWEALIRDVVHYRFVLAGRPDPAPEVVELNGHAVTGGFLGLWRKYGLEVMGFPVSDEYRETVDIPGEGPTEVTFQDWENVVTEWRPGLDARIGAGVRKYKYKK
jgi:N-acetylmuramoyl-L-alanine amidase